MKKSIQTTKVLFCGIGVVLLSLSFYALHQVITTAKQLPQYTPTSMPTFDHTIGETNGVETIWEIKNAYVLWNRMDTTLDSARGIACYLGDYGKRKNYGSVICLDDKNGEILWENVSGRALVVTTEGVFVSFSHPAGIRKYAINNGELVWRKTLGGSGTLYLSYVNDQLQVLGNTEDFWVLDTEGKLIRKENGNMIFFSTSDETYVNLNGLQVFKTNTDELVWEFTDFSLVLPPLITSDKIFLRDGNLKGSIIALDRESGDFVWKTDDKIISNIVYSPEENLIYALHQDGNLLSIDANSGEEKTIVNFLPDQFVLDGENIDAYELAYDQEGHILVLSLGDSQQLIAFREN